MTDDLFAAFAAELEAAPPAPPPVVTVPARSAPPAPPPQAWPGDPVASFACDCGARDEVLEPAPETVDCWGCKLALGMRRWSPPRLPPSGNARGLTAAERERMNADAA